MGSRPEEITEKKKMEVCWDWTVECAKRRVPIVDWLPRYDWRENLWADSAAGLTLACIHIPQGLAFGLLAGGDPVLGLYTSCFATFVYCLLGTAHVGSFGPVAVGSMLVGEAVASQAGGPFTLNQLVAAITLLVGFYYLIAFFLRLGVLAAIFTKPFTSGLIAGCTLHIIIKNIKYLLGLKIKNQYGYLNLFFNLKNLLERVGDSNVPTVILSVVVLILLALNAMVLRPAVRKCTVVVIPVEAAVVAIGVLVSWSLELESKGVPVVGHVPMGLPSLVAPSLDAAAALWAQALVVAAVNYSTTTSMTVAFNKRLDPLQELFALAAANLLSAPLQCVTIGNSMMRTAIATSLGVRTLLSSIISCIFLFFVILFAGPLFEPLPECVLGCIIMAGAVMLIWARIKDLPSVFRTSWEDGSIWTASFLTVVVLDIQFGMVAGGILSLRKILAEKVARDALPDQKQELLPRDPKSNV